MNPKKFSLKKMLATAVVALLSTYCMWSQTNVHVVKEGETLYRLSVMYGITVEQILNANPGMSAQALKIGSTVQIPNSALGLTAGNTNLVESKKTHVVKSKETLWSISQQYQVNIDEIKKANPQLAPNYNIKKGATINIPTSTKSNQANVNSIKIAVLLPIAEKGMASGRTLEFYRGFLMAAEDLKEQGNHFTIYTYEEPTDQSSMSKIMEKIKAKNVDLLVGPLYLSHFSEIANYAKSGNTKVLIPFSSKVDTCDYCPNLFMLNTPNNKKKEWATQLFMEKFPKESSRVIFVGEELKGNESEFTNHLKEELKAQGYTIGSLPINFEMDDLHAYSRAGLINILVPNSSTIPMLKNITKLVKEYRTLHPKSDVAILGYSEWQGAAKDYRQDLHFANTYLISNSFFNPWATETKRFIERYKYWFKQDLLEVTPNMAILGYDSGLYMLKGIGQYGKHFTNQISHKTFLQSKIKFEQINEDGAYTNRNLWLIHYRTDGAIERIEAKQ